jgi:hypothetical protein
VSPGTLLIVMLAKAKPKRKVAAPASSIAAPGTTDATAASERSHSPAPEHVARLMALGVAHSEESAARVRHLELFECGTSGYWAATTTTAVQNQPRWAISGVADGNACSRQVLEAACGDVDSAAVQLVRAAGGGGTVAGSVANESSIAALADLAERPEIRQLRAMVAHQPHLMRPLVQQLGVAAPAALELIATHPAAFARLLTGAVPPQDLSRHVPHAHGIPAGVRNCFA